MFTGSLVALVTPMGSDGSIDYACLQRLIDWHVDAGTAALVIAGTTGESATLTKSEHADVICRSVEMAGGRIPVIAGTGSNSTQQTIELSQKVGTSAIAGYLMVTPYYNKPTQEGLYQHFTAIADAVDEPVMLYNVPGRTAVDLVPGTVGRLSEHPRIFGIKEATGDVGRVREIIELAGSDFRLYSGDDASAREFMLAGGHGVVSVTSNVAPEAMARMCDAAVGGDSAGAAELDAPLADLHRDLFVESNPIPVKWALERMGRIPGGIRLPLTRLSAEHEPAVEAALVRAGIV
ncbi:MAG: 4-hydroxy-tetrahydrodipicolinate synthase [Gammaproteobacteria bacterium]|nr:4-hydroxy-tetrahydrodipicolinate synthase [Gammaproteobacteria bacterium]